MPIGVPLDNIELENISRAYNTPWIEYEELASIPDLRAWFRSRATFSVIVLLSSDTSDVGHWVLLSERTDKCVELFDSIGGGTIGTARKLGYTGPDLVRQCAKRSGYTRVQSNTVPLQRPDSNVCGKWVLLRLLSGGCKLPKFQSFWGSIPDPDAWIDTLIQIPGAA